MLKRLYISNFALIEEMDVAFPGQLTVITGETGAGKSIFLEALGLALGRRADAQAVKDKKRKCIVEAEFYIRDLAVNDFFKENDLEYNDNLVLRRELSAEGKSRSFLNDQLVNVSVLKALADRLIDVHSQHQTLLLNNSSFQLRLLDAFAGTTVDSEVYRASYRELQKSRQALDDLLAQQVRAQKETDYHQFLFEELKGAGLEAGQARRLQDEAFALENAEAIKHRLSEAAGILSASDHGVLSALAHVKQNLQSITKYGQQYQQFAERAQSAYIELKDLAGEIENSAEDTVFDATRLDAVNSQLDRIGKLLKKHAVTEESELLSVMSDLEQKLAAVEDLETQISSARKTLQIQEEKCKKAAKELSAKRAKACAPLEEKVCGLLSELSLENAVFKIQMEQLAEPGEHGIDIVRFQFNANKGGLLNDIEKVASGGELSRLMLVLKALLASKKSLPAIVFDEIDSGVSGDVAHKIGNILLRMSGHMQVITITHLPQMASKGKHHLFVYKNDEEEKTVSSIRLLSREERINEIAKMLSTSNPTQSALRNARELLEA